MRLLTRTRMIAAATAAATAAGAAGLAVAANIATLPPGAVNHPTEVGPISGETGFPVWYRDSSGLRLEGCLQTEDPLCAIPAAEMPNPDAATSWPDNFPLEHFYMLAQAELALDGGRAVLTTGVEATFSTEEIKDGDQVTFGRVRIVVKGASPNTEYKFYHPYGIDVVTTDGTGDGRYVEDVGIGGPGDFTGALRSRIGPFLKWTSGAPAGYIGDPDVLHAVTGSPYQDETGAAQNYFRAVGGATEVRTDLFSISGKLATNSGLSADSAVYTPTEDGGSIDVFARSEAGQALQVKTSNLWPTTTLAGTEGSYYARLGYTGTKPESVTIVNASDQPVTAKTIPVVDAVTITSARYNNATGELTVEATSTDPAATLTGTGTTVVAGPPATVKVTSSSGGSDTAPVSGTGPATAGVALAAAIAANAQVSPGARVTLDGASSQGDIVSYAWVQTGGPAVDLTVAADGKSATFTAPATIDTALEFRLTVTGPGGATASSTMPITTAAAPAAAPTASAGTDQGVRIGSTVTLDGSGSTDVNDYAWTQTAGPAVTLSNAAAAKPTFTMPSAAVTFELTVTGPGGTAKDTVVVTPITDTLTGTAEYRSDKREWRISGTATVTTGNRVTVRVGTSATGTIIGTATVAADRTWSVRVSNSPVPSNASVRAESNSGAEPIVLNVRLR